MNLFSGRARKKIDELDRLLEIAKNNFRQLGGKLNEDREKAREIKESERWVILNSNVLQTVLLPSSLVYLCLCCVRGWPARPNICLLARSNSALRPPISTVSYAFSRTIIANHCRFYADAVIENDPCMTHSL